MSPYMRRKKKLNHRILRVRNRIARGDEWASLIQKLKRDEELLAELKGQYGSIPPPRKRKVPVDILSLREPDNIHYRKNQVSTEWFSPEPVV